MKNVAIMTTIFRLQNKCCGSYGPFCFVFTEIVDDILRIS